MGQRFQVLISAPPAYRAPGNPNNRDREYHIWHCQWLFGASAVIYCDMLMQKVEELIKFEQRDTTTINEVWSENIAETLTS